MRELTEPVDLCLPDGRLNPAAVGWSRRPLHRTNLRGWGRTKRWEYWGVITPTHILGLTVSSLDYIAVHQVYLLDRATGQERELGAIVPLAKGAILPDTRPPITVRGRGKGVELDFVDELDGSGRTSIRAAVATKALALDVELVAGVPIGGESLSVVVPWDDMHFQYTVKDPARPVLGRIVVDGTRIDIGTDSWAVLDRGRGRWPYRMTWNWAAGSGIAGGHRIGLQLGGLWTVATGMTENALIVDGVVDPIPVELDWELGADRADGAWRIRGERVDATLTPEHTRHARTNALVIASDTVQAFGTWSGRARGSDGTEYRLDGLVGWAEQARNRW